MKKIISLLCLLFPVLIFSQGTATLSGTVKGEIKEPIKVYYGNYFLEGAASTTFKKISDGSFELNFPLENPSFVDLVIGKKAYPLFMEPGKKLSLTIDLSGSPLSLVYAGDLSAENNFMVQFRKNFTSSYDSENIKAEILAANSADLFEMGLFQDQKKQEKFLNGSKLKGRFGKAFMESINEYISYNYWNRLLAFPIIRANSSPAMSVIPLPRVMIEPIHERIINPESALDIPSFREFLYYFVTYKGSEGNGYKKFSDMDLSIEKKIEVIEKNITGKGYDYIFSRFLTENCERISQPKFLSYYGKIESKNKDFAKIIKARCEPAFAKKTEPKTASKKENAGSSSKTVKKDLPYTLYDLNDKQVALEDFKGKAVYIDFWASWCGPCMRQMPFSKELHKKFTKKELKKVEFLYISLDRDKARWKGAVDRLQLEGLHTFSPGAWGSSAAKYFRLSSIPRYMLMDKKGKIVNPNAKRPSDPSIYEDLIKMINE